MVRTRRSTGGGHRAYFCFPTAALLLSAVAAAPSCSDPEFPFDPAHPARGPGQMVVTHPVDSQPLAPSTSMDPAPSSENRVACDANCDAYCAQLAPSLTNPVDRGICRNLWGMGLDTQPIDRNEACRRLFVDMLGHYPTRDEVDQTCPPDRPWSDVVTDLMGRDEFVLVNQRLWADRLLYNNQSINVERIYDADDLVGKLYRGLVSYDEFAAVISAHPVLTRRYDTPQDRAEALFNLFIGRPPYESERADMGRLYVLWSNGYFDHPTLAARLPDAYIKYQCVDDQGNVDNDTKGQCTSVLWGYNQLILQPDIRADNGQIWCGLLRPDEWQQLELPGRIVGQQLAFWEHAVDLVIQQYLGYDLVGPAPGVREELVSYLLAHNGDIRAVHHAVASSLIYLQSSSNPAPADQVVNSARYTYGPLKQTMVEPWIDSIRKTTGFTMGDCDWRISEPDLLLQNDGVASMSLLEESRWKLDKDGIVDDYENLARTLGGCPDNQVGGRFTTVSILNTAVQENFVFRVCNPKLDPNARAAPIERLLPPGVGPSQALDPDLAASILDYQVGLFLSRSPTQTETDEARAAADECNPKPCTAEAFARPMCFALLSSAEQLFY